MEVIYKLSIIFAMMGIGFYISKILKIPHVIGYITAGIIYGYFMEFPKMGVKFVEEIAVMLLFFFIGLEFSIRKLKPIAGSILGVSMADFILNFGIAFALSFIMTKNILISLTIGALFYPSSSIIIAKLLESRRRLSNIEVPLIFGVLIFEDIVMILLLSFITNVGKVSFLKIGLVVGFIILAFIMNITLRNQLLSIIRAVRRYEDEFRMLIIISVLFVFSSMVMPMGIHAYFGSFLLGVILADTDEALFEESLSDFKDMFLALFFFLFGYEISHIQIQFSYIPIAFGLFAGSVLLKTFSVLLSQYSTKVKLRAGFTLAPRGEFSILILPFVPENLMGIFAIFVLLSIFLGIFISDNSHRLSKLLTFKKKS